MWKCSICGTINAEDNRICRCGAERSRNYFSSRTLAPLSETDKKDTLQIRAAYLQGRIKAQDDAYRKSQQELAESIAARRKQEEEAERRRQQEAWAKQEAERLAEQRRQQEAARQAELRRQQEAARQAEMRRQQETARQQLPADFWRTRLPAVLTNDSATYFAPAIPANLMSNAMKHIAKGQAGPEDVLALVALKSTGSFPYGQASDGREGFLITKDLRFIFSGNTTAMNESAADLVNMQMRSAHTVETTTRTGVRNILFPHYIDIRKLLPAIADAQRQLLGRQPMTFTLLTGSEEAAIEQTARKSAQSAKTGFLVGIIIFIIIAVLTAPVLPGITIFCVIMAVMFIALRSKISKDNPAGP